MEFLTAPIILIGVVVLYILSAIKVLREYERGVIFHADIISKNPQTIQLRFLGTLTEIAAEKNSTIVFPLPLELLRAFTCHTSQEKK
jgi:hypothetical protein